MKTTSLKSSLVFVILLAAVTSCNLQNKKADAETQYKQIVPVLNKGNFMRHEGEPDSAIAYYIEGRNMLKDLISGIDTTKDTAYTIALANTDNYLGLSYDTLGKWEQSLPYFLESLKMLTHCRIGLLKLFNEELLFDSYANIQESHAKDISPDSSKKLFLKERDYSLAACWDIDKLGLNKTSRALSDYRVMSYVYTKLGDTAHRKFYDEKASVLYDEQHGIERP